MSLAFLFPGQGSQSVGMLAALGDAYPEVKASFATASDVLGYDLWALIQNGPKEELDRTDRTQPAMLTAGVAVWRAWRQRGGARPLYMAGHSLGEYTALVCAGALPFEQAVAAVAARGRYMQQAVPAGQGAMAAILGLDDADIIEACGQAAQGEVVAAVNFNSPGQVVIAGDAAAVARAMELAKQAGAKRAMTLPVSVPSHCSLMRPAAAHLAAYLETLDIKTPEIPVVNNVDVNRVGEPASIRDALVRQLVSPVRWVETIRALASHGVNTVIECGPGKVLAGLNKRIHQEMTAVAVFDPASLDEALALTEIK